MIINYFSLKQSLRDRSMKSHAWTHSVYLKHQPHWKVCSLVPGQHWFHGLSIGSWVSRAQWEVKMSLGLCSLFNLIWKHLSPFPTWKLQRSSRQLNSRIKMSTFRIKRDWFLLTKISSGEWNFSIFYETFYSCAPKFLYFLSHFVCFLNHVFHAFVPISPPKCF